MNKAICPADKWLIVNSESQQPLESWHAEHQAHHFCRRANDHEVKNGRPPRRLLHHREEG
jgi:hypothetical protein